MDETAADERVREVEGRLAAAKPGSIEYAEAAIELRVAREEAERATNDETRSVVIEPEPSGQPATGAGLS